jgi:hypothetical protein
MKLREVIGGWCTCKSKMHLIFVLQNQSGTTVSAYAPYILPAFPLGYIRTLVNIYVHTFAFALVSG